MDAHLAGAAGGASTAGRLARWAAAALCLGAAAASVALYRDDLGERRALSSFIARFAVDARRPAYVATAEVAPAADFAAAVLADAALEDALSPVRLATMNAALRQLWLRAAADGGLELEAARDLMLRALDRRPGWPFHHFLLGKLVYVAERRAGSQTLGETPDRWERPLLAAVRRAPGLISAATFLGGAYLETWPDLPAATRQRSPEILRRALEDDGFVSRAFVTAARRLGPDAAAWLLPERPGPLGSAQSMLARSGDVPGAVALQRRWESAERKARARDLAAAEERLRYGHTSGLKAACDRWVREHPASAFDDVEARRQVARILQIWPSETGGSWHGDPRAELVRFFLEGRLDEVSAPAVSHALSVLDGVPDPIRALGFLLADDTYGYDRILRESATAGALEWTAFLVHLARTRLAAGDAEGARTALSRVAPPARRECDVLLARRELATARPDAAELAEVERELAAARPAAYGGEAFASGSTLPLCVDPLRDLSIGVEVEAASPALVAYGFDGGRSGSTLVSGVARIEVPLSGRAGRRLLSVTAFLGPKVKVRGATLTSSAPSAASSRRLQDAAASEAPTAAASVAGIAGSEKLNSTRP